MFSLKVLPLLYLLNVQVVLKVCSLMITKVLMCLLIRWHTLTELVYVGTRIVTLCINIFVKVLKLIFYIIYSFQTVCCLWDGWHDLNDPLYHCIALFCYFNSNAYIYLTINEHYENALNLSANFIFNFFPPSDIRVP